MSWFQRKPIQSIPGMNLLDKPLSREECGAIARRLSDKYADDGETMTLVWQMMDTISLLYVEKFYRA